MTRIEERLQDALQASAARVRDDRLRLFPGLQASTRLSAEPGPTYGTRPGAEPGPTYGTGPDAEPGPTSGTGPGAGLKNRRGWRTWLIPAAAAVSVLLVIGLVTAVSSGLKHTTGDRQAPSASLGTGPGGIPAYMAEFEPTVRERSLVVRSTSTGAVVASAQTPVVPLWSLMTGAVAAAPDDRTFYAEFDASHGAGASVVQQIWIYRLSITGSGAATPLTRISGGVMPGVTRLGHGGSMAVSPDGTKLALTADVTGQLSTETSGWADKLIVIDLGTGARSSWQGGLYRSGKTFTIPYISWNRNGRSLVYLGLWCSLPDATNLCLGGGTGLNAYRDTQVRSVAVSTGGGTLDQGAVLLRQSARYLVIAAALAGPAGRDLTLFVLSGRLQSLAWSSVAVDHVASAGSLLGVDYRGPAHGGEGQPDLAWIGADPSGQHVLLGYDGPQGFVLGWVANGVFHRLPTPRYGGGSVAW